MSAVGTLWASSTFPTVHGTENCSSVRRSRRCGRATKRTINHGIALLEPGGTTQIRCDSSRSFTENLGFVLLPARARPDHSSFTKRLIAKGLAVAILPFRHFSSLLSLCRLADCFKDRVFRDIPGDKLLNLLGEHREECCAD